MKYTVLVRNEKDGDVQVLQITESCPQTAQEAALLLLFRQFAWSHSTASVPVEEPW